jgi:hypothetical protein
MKLRTRIRAAVNYWRSIGREPVSAKEHKARVRAKCEQLRRELAERDLVRAVEQARGG